jgi:hypothetical protein
LAALQTAVTAAQTLLSGSPSQAEVDAATTSLLLALSKVHRLGDKAVLLALLQVAVTLNADQFTPSSWAPLATAVTAGQAVADDDQASQYDVDDAVVAIETALGGLILRAVKAGLVSAITVAQSILAASGAYVPSTLTGLSDALAAAVTVNDNLDATQPQVTAAQTALVTAISRAKLRSSGTSPLPAAVAVKAAGDQSAAQATLGAAAKPLAKPTVKGKAKVGAKLKAKVTGAAAKAVSFQWYRSGKAIKGAVKATYQVKAADKGKVLRVKVKVAGVTKTSARTARVR